METDHEQLKNLLTETLTLMLRSGLKFKNELNIEGLLGVSIDKQDVFFVHISKKFNEERGEQIAETVPSRSDKPQDVIDVEELPSENSGEHNIDITPSSREDNIQNDYSNDVSDDAEYEDSQNLASPINVEPTEYRDEEDLENSQSSFSEDPQANVVPHPVALFSTGNGEIIGHSQSSRESVVTGNSWPEEEFSQSYGNVEIMEPVDIEEISDDEADQPYIIQPEGVSVNQWPTDMHPVSSVDTSQSNSQSSFSNNHWGQSSSPMAPQKFPETLSRLGTIQYLDLDSGQFAGIEKSTAFLVNVNEEPSFKRPASKKRSRRAKVKEKAPNHCRVCKLKNGHRHVCPVCSKCNKAPSDLRRHMRTHTGERPFDCEFCDMKFKCSGTKYTHQRNVHNLKRH